MSPWERWFYAVGAMQQGGSRAEAMEAWREMMVHHEMQRRRYAYEVMAFDSETVDVLIDWADSELQDEAARRIQADAGVVSDG